MYHSSSSHGYAVAADRILTTQALRSRHASAGIEASRRTRIPSPPAEPPVLVLWLNQVTRRFFGELRQTPRADSGRECNTLYFCSVLISANDSLNLIPNHTWSTLSQNPSINPSYPFDLLCQPRTFGMFTKISLNTSKSL
jgi:hypothetical protein